MKALIIAGLAILLLAACEAKASDRHRSSNEAEAEAIANARANALAVSAIKTTGATVTTDTKTKVDAEPAASARFHLTSTGCIGSVGGGGQAPAIGVAVGITRDHVDCFKIEAAKLQLGKGNAKDANQLLCSIEWYSAAVSSCTKTKAQAMAERKLYVAQVKRIMPEAVAMIETPPATVEVTE